MDASLETQWEIDTSSSFQVAVHPDGLLVDYDESRIASGPETSAPVQSIQDFVQRIATVDRLEVWSRTSFRL